MGGFAVCSKEELRGFSSGVMCWCGWVVGRWFTDVVVVGSVLVGSGLLGVWWCVVGLVGCMVVCVGWGGFDVCGCGVVVRLWFGVGGLGRAGGAIVVETRTLWLVGWVCG